VAALGGWGDFFVAQAGAAAVLAGLVFVGVSINLDKIIAIPSLPSRALEAMVLLIAVLVESSLMLVPDQSLTLLGLEVLAVGLVVWLAIGAVQRDVLRKLDPQHRRLFSINIALGQLAVLAFVVAGVVLLIAGEDGVYFAVPGVILGYLVAISEAWILLVEIHR
jgi:hypothetical protein